MRLLFIIESLGGGGAEHALVNLMPALRRRGHHCEVAVLWPPYELAGTLEEMGVRVHRLKVRHRWSAVEATLKIAALARRRRCDVLHSHLFFANIYTALSKIGAPGPRRAVSFHDVVYDIYPAHGAWQKLRKSLDSRLMRHGMDGYSAVSHAVAAHFTEQLGLAPVRVIPNAFPIEKLRPLADVQRGAVLTDYQFSAEDFVIVIPARLVPSKGHRFFIEALEILRARQLCPKALILGHGPLAEALADEVKQRRLDDQIIFCGRIPQEKLLPIIQVADAVVLPSTHEGFGLAPAEAMALETPVLASRVGGLVDLIEDGVSGLMVPPGDAQALADGIAQLMADVALRQRLGRAGRQRIVEHFSAEAVAAQWEDFYRDLLAPLDAARD